MGHPDQQQPDDFVQAVALLKKHNALGLALNTAEAHATKGTARLKTLPESPIRHDLNDLIYYAVKRDH